jgi:hypothetical protein
VEVYKWRNDGAYVTETISPSDMAARGPAAMIQNHGAGEREEASSHKEITLAALD